MFINYSEVLIAQLLRQFLLKKSCCWPAVVSCVREVNKLVVRLPKNVHIVKFHIVNDLVEIHAYRQA